MNDWKTTEMKDYWLSKNYRAGWESLDQPLYDIQTFPSGGVCNRLSFFSTPVGQCDKSYADTNMELASVLPSRCEFLCQSVRITMPDPATDNDRMRLYWGGSFTLMIGSTVYLRLPMIRFVIEPFELSSSLLLPSSMNFVAEIQWPKLIKLVRGVRICVELRGLMYRKTV